METPAMHVCSDTIEWKTSYHHTNIDQKLTCGYPHVFLLSLLPDLQEVGTTKPAEVIFNLKVVLMKKRVHTREDLQWNWMGRTAEKISGSIGAGGTYVEWECEERERVRPQSSDRIELFKLKTTTPLRLVKGNQTCYNLHIKITFHLGGSLMDQLPLLRDLLYPLPSPRPGSSYDDSVSLVSRPPNLALQISLTEPNRIHHVWLQKEELAAASEYLAKLVKIVPEPEDAVFATRSLDGRIDFVPVDDDSDSEEDTRRYNLFKEREKVGDEDEVRRSEAPEPAEDKSDGDELQPPAKRSKTNPDVGGSDEDSDEDEENREAASLPIWPAIMDTRAPEDGTQVIGVPDCALSTLQAVIVWIVTGIIVFAPLSAGGKEKRTSIIEASIKENPKRPVPVSPRSVYRLAERFKMDRLALIAMDDLKGKMKWKNAASLSLHLDCKYYPEHENLVHTYVRKNWNNVRAEFDRIELKEVYQFILYANLLKPIAAKLRD